MNHGTAYRYNLGCRCDACRAASTAKRRRARAKARALRSPAYLRELAAARALKERYRGTCQDCGAPTSWSDSKRPIKRCDPCHRKSVAAQHGTPSKYNAGCRCADCRSAHRDRMRTYRRKRQVAA